MTWGSYLFLVVLFVFGLLIVAGSLGLLKDGDECRRNRRKGAWVCYIMAAWLMIVGIFFSAVSLGTIWHYATTEGATQ